MRVAAKYLSINIINVIDFIFYEILLPYGAVIRIRTSDSDFIASRLLLFQNGGLHTSRVEQRNHTYWIILHYTNGFKASWGQFSVPYEYLYPFNDNWNDRSRLCRGTAVPFGTANLTSGDQMSSWQTGSAKGNLAWFPKTQDGRASAPAYRWHHRLRSWQNGLVLTQRRRA